MRIVSLLLSALFISNANAIASLSDFCNILNAIDTKYLCEEYSITTEDNYIMLIYRIPSTTKEIIAKNKPAMAFMHGTWQSADSMISLSNYIGRPLALEAVDMGFDVWFLNSRGTKYSTHKTLNKVNNPKQFYDYTWQQKGQYDIPAGIKFIQTTTNHPKIILWATG